MHPKSHTWIARSKVVAGGLQRRSSEASGAQRQLIYGIRSSSNISHSCTAA